MKRVAMLCLVSLSEASAFGQHRGGSMAGGAAPGGSRAAIHTNGHSPVRHRAYRSAGFYPYAYPAFDGGYDYEYAPEPNVIVVPQPAPQVMVPPREVRSEIREYAAPAQGAITPSPAERGEAVTFAVALVDGSRHAASAVWVQDGFLHYVDGEDEHHQVALSSVDRQLTRRLNRERNLDFWLPGTQ